MSPAARPSPVTSLAPRTGAAAALHACISLALPCRRGRPYLQAAGQAAPSHRPALWPQGRGRGRGVATRRRLRLAAFLPPGPAGDLTPTCMQPSDHARHCLSAAPVPGCEAWYFPARAAPNRAQSPSRPGDWRHLVRTRGVFKGEGFIWTAYRSPSIAVMNLWAMMLSVRRLAAWQSQRISCQPQQQRAARTGVVCGGDGRVDVARAGEDAVARVAHEVAVAIAAAVVATGYE